MNNKISNENRQSPLHTFLSLILPGLGQMLAKQWQRGLTILIGVGLMGSLSIWTIGQRARYPNFALSFKIFAISVLEMGALLIFLMSLNYLLNKYIIKDKTAQAFSGYGVGLLYFILIFLLSGPVLELAGTVAELKTVYLTTTIFSAGALAAFWIWQAFDAGKIGALKAGEAMPSLGFAVLVLCLLIFSLGYQITEIDLNKAISEYTDTQIILTRLTWPWRSAFAFEQDVLEVAQKIQAPCPAGSVGPDANLPMDGETWISLDNTCGELTTRDLQGKVTFGTEITIFGGGFTPGQKVEIWWRNPIGNPFKPRGVGETDIIMDERGEFETKLYIPEMTVIATAVGDQIHTILVREKSEERFTGALSDEMKLALKGMLETIMLGLMATFFGIILAFPLSFLAARNLMASIVQTLAKMVGGVIGLVVGVGLTGVTMTQIIKLFGGLDKAPIPILMIAILLLFGISWLFMSLGGRLFEYLSKLLGKNGDTILSVIGMTLIGVAPGYLLGLGFSRGIRGIPLKAELAAETEMTFAIGGAILFGILGFYYALRQGGSRNINVGMIAYTTTRTIMNIIRSIEPLIWGLVAVIWIGPGPFAGFIALTLHTVAALGKLYSESIESIDPGPIEALQATGANRLQTIVFAVVPQILPPFISFTIYRWDINVRMSTVIGLVGGGGIGFILIQWIRLFQYDNAGLAVWLIAITVATLDYISSNIRKRFV
ncbi:MAG: ABC transporter permease subunit [Chloroflexi bacterium]|jgi:phosphonate ABC transporter permease subunit PhnE|nr:ABC transporter permease subunit [Chloroflexota bacterium]MBT3668614.1 ABC transporter permease subunit [Chloroflexota bacterium]MBT4306241.1 ABC transporter permease subunit [Chloroflexota bacterium]MBT4532878.1 ABC transporter permease subunit [Chloroflexota bacterium]MBT4683437.1 ABC transporter permease subunit [Chloroflexota bacterium]